MNESINNTAHGAELYISVHIRFLMINHGPTKLDINMMSGQQQL